MKKYLWALALVLTCALTHAQALSPVADFIATIATATTTATASSGSFSLTVASATGIKVYQAVSAAGIPAGTIVTNVSGTTIAISVATSSSLSSSSVTFGGLPSASANPNKRLLIIDASTACDVATGGASTRVLAVSNGSAWTAPNCGGGSGTGIAVCSASNSATPNVLTCTIGGFSLTTGALVNLFLAVANTSTTVTLTINSGTTYTVYRGTGNAPSIGQLDPSATPLVLSFNGSAFYLVNDSYEAGSTNALVISRTAFPWTIDINTSAVPQLTTTNTFSGKNVFSAELGIPNSGSLPATCSTGDVYQDTAASAGSQLNLCTSNTWTPQGGGGSVSAGANISVSGSTVSFNPADPTTIWWDEPWAGNSNGGNAAATWGCNGGGYTSGVGRWIGYTNNAGGTCAWAYSDANHGSVMSVTSASGSATWDQIYGPQFQPGVATNWTLTNILKTDSSTTNLVELNAVGYLNTANASGCETTTTTADCIAIVYEPGTSANWLLVSCSSGTAACTNISTGVAYATGTWFKFTLSSAASGTIKGQVNSGSVVSISTNVPTATMFTTPLVTLTNPAAARTFLLNKTTFFQTGVTRP